MHIVCRPNKELLLLLLNAHILLALPLILLLQLHVPVLVFTVREGVIQALSVVPGLLCILLAAACALGARGMWQLEVVFAVLARVHRYRLHVKATAVHGCILRTSLLILRHFDIQCARFVLVKQIVELVVRRTVHCLALMG